MKKSILSAVFAIASLATTARADSFGCTFRTVNGNYLTAVGSGGRITDVIHSDATRAAAWEKFNIRYVGKVGSRKIYAFQTGDGHYLTATGGGGKVNDAIHSDAVQIRDWEKFSFEYLAPDTYGIRTYLKGRYLTAVGGGGRITDVIHTNAVRARAWERFYIKCER